MKLSVLFLKSHFQDLLMLGEPAAPRLTFAQLRHELVVLFKLRIVYLLLAAATAGAFLVAGGWPGLGILAVAYTNSGAIPNGGIVGAQRITSSATKTL